MMDVKNPEGKSVDWWFLYKTPEHTGRQGNSGDDFFYYDPNQESLQLSTRELDQDNQALAQTLNSVFNAPKSAGFIVYNDEHVDQQSNHSSKGHCKGIIAFDKESDSAFFLLHSTPRFPANNEIELPDDERIYGQTFICITLPNYATANQIAQQMLEQQNPQILTESSRIPESLGKDEPLSLLFHGTQINESKQPSTLKFHSKGGKEFLLVAKSKHWGEDFWLDLVSPTLKCDLVVETWRRGKVTPLQDMHSTCFDEDTLSLCFKFSSSKAYEWSYTKDHAKWAIALKNETNQLPWVCVADMNRMVSQEKRGGGCLCFQEEALWNALKNAEEKLHLIEQPESP